MLFLYAVIFATTFICIFNYVKMKRVGSSFVGPPFLPFIGNGHQFSAGTSADFFKVITGFGDEYGARFRVFIGQQFFVLLSDPKDVEVILTSNHLIEKSTDYDYLMPWLGTGLLTSKGEKWRKHRKVITPTFHFKILENFIQVFESQGDILLSKLQTQVDKGSFDLFPYVTLTALDIISEASMGISIEAQNNSDSEYVTAVQEICRIINDRQKNPIKRSDFLFMLSKDFWKQKKSLKILHDMTDKMVQERKALLSNSENDFTSYTSDDSNEIFGAKRKLAFLDMLLLSTVDGKPLSDIDIRQEVDTFLFEGHDTTTSGITFTLYLLAQYPEIQQKVFDEQREIFGNDFNQMATYKDLQSMKYLELVIKESLRLYPPVPLIARKIQENTHINDMFIPAGSTVLILVYNMNRNPDVFPDPLKCIPERFSLDVTNKRNPFATVSFSAGPRNCIGQKFAMLEMKSTISKIIRKYRLLSSDEELVLTANIILKAVDGVKVKIVDRN